MPLRHWWCGFSTTVVSIMSSCAGSVAVFARPTLPNTLATSGNVMRIESCRCIAARAAVMEAPGTVVGM